MINIPKITEEEVSIIEKQALDFKSPRYKTVYRKNGMVVDLTKNVLKDTDKTLRVYASFPNCTPKELYDCITDDEYSKRFDTAVEELIKLEDIDENRLISYYRSKSPPIVDLIVSKREFLTQRFQKKYSDNKYIIFNRSVEDHPDCPKNIKNSIRAQVNHLLYWIVKDKKNVTKLIYYANCDFKGKVPQFCIHWMSGLLAPQMVKKLRDSVKKYPNYLAERASKEVRSD